LGGIYEVPPIFLFALLPKGGLSGPAWRLLPIVFLGRALINAQIAAGYALTLGLRDGHAQSFMEHSGVEFDIDNTEYTVATLYCYCRRLSSYSGDGGRSC
jgi:hypothetical protein